jgi:hypothetical protein
MPKKPQRSKNKNRKKDSQNTKISRQFLYKNLWGFIRIVGRSFKYLIRKSFVVIITAIPIYFAYANIQPRIIVSHTLNPPDALNTDFTFTNEGYLFTLYNTKATVDIKKIKYKDEIHFNLIGVQNYDILNIGNIEPRQSSTTKFPFDAMKINKILESAEICFYVRYTVLFPFYKRDIEQKFGFFADTKSKTDHLIRRECK